MKILVDENIPLMTTRALKRLGHDVSDLRGTPDQGADDEILWGKVQREQRALITTDIRVRTISRVTSLWHLDRSPPPTQSKEIHERVMRAIAQFEPAQWRGMLVVMRDTVQSVSRRSRE